MTRDETKKLLAVLKTSYPNFYSKQSDEELTAAINLWLIALQNMEYDVINAGLGPLIQNLKFPPTVAEVIESARKSAPDPLEIQTIVDAEYRRLNPKTWNGDGRNHAQRKAWLQEHKKLAESQKMRISE